MPLGKGQRRVLYTLGFALIGLLALWFALPLWFPWVLGPAARRAGIRFDAYQREGYARFALQGVTLTNASVHFQAARVQAATPSAWGWRRLMGKTRQPEPFVRIEDWQWASVGSRRTNASVYREVQELGQRLSRLAYWVPHAVLTNGTAHLGGQVVGVPELRWDEGKLRARLELPDHQPVTVTGDLGKGPPYTLEVRSEPLHLQAEVQVRLTRHELQLQSTGNWWTNRIELQAVFGRSGWWPLHASLQAPKFLLPAALLQLEGYRDLSGSLSAQWEHGRFGLDLGARAQPLAAQVHLPPVRLDLHAAGNTNAVTIQSARVSSPGFQAELSRELTLHFNGPLLHRSATLRVTADLGRQHWTPLQGQLTGEADFVPTAARLPVAFLHLNGTDIGNPRVKAKRFQLNATLNWPWLEITSASGEFEDGAVASGEGKVELVRETIVGGRFQVSGPLGSRLLPPGYGYNTLSLTGTVQGPLEAPVHSGHLEVSALRSPELQPMQVRADWHGKKRSIEHAELTAATAHAALQASGALELSGGESTLQLTNLSLSTNGERALVLTRPCRAALSRAENEAGWQVTLTPLELAGQAGEAHVQGSMNWPKQGELQVAIRNLSSSLLAGFAKAAVPEVQIERLNGSAAWSNGPVRLALELAGNYGPQAGAGVSRPRALQKAASGDGRSPPRTAARSPRPSVPWQAFNQPLAFELKLRGDQTGLQLSNLVVSSQGAPLARAHGRLPLTFNPARPGQFVRFETEHPLQFEAAAQPQAAFWEEIATLAGVTLRGPDLKLRVAGTWQAPTGRLDLHAQQIRFEQGPTNLPALKDLEVAVAVDPGHLRLTEGRVFVQGQPVLLTAEVPLEARFWEDVRQSLRTGAESAQAPLRADALRAYHHASARVLVPTTELAAFSELFPKVLSPEGEVSLDLAIRPGLKLDGNLVLSHARTRPLANAGPIRDIEVRVRFAGRTLELERASAGVGGSTLTARGTADLRGAEWLRGALPPFQFRLSGTNVPLAREASAIIRSDLNIALTKTNGAPPLVSGTARLRNSFYLKDLASLVSGRVATPEQRPPYFSVEDPMLGAWRLSLRVEGQRFLKVLSPLFNGEVSANLHLQGTLKDPIALGDLTTDSGVVRFPFANFQVRQGLVTLSSQDPFRPRLFVLGDSRQFGYDLRMDLTGPVDAPVLQFTSTPPLASEQILLMVTAGELPRGSFTLNSQQRAETMAMFLGRDLLSKLGFGDETEQRLSIRTNEEISQVGHSTYNVEYRLSKRWSVEGEYDRFGDFNAGFKWRIYSK